MRGREGERGRGGEGGGEGDQKHSCGLWKPLYSIWCKGCHNRSGL